MSDVGSLDRTVIQESSISLDLAVIFFSKMLLFFLLLLKPARAARKAVSFDFLIMKRYSYCRKTFSVINSILVVV